MDNNQIRSAMVERRHIIYMSYSQSLDYENRLGHLLKIEKTFLRKIENKPQGMTKF